jgi:dienelactone hydrolase
MKRPRFVTADWVVAVAAVYAALIVLMPLPSVVAADTNSEWKPLLDNSKQPEAANGRPIDTYRHDASKEWGYVKGKRNTVFYVVHPKKDRERAPLYVVLHGAGHSSWSALEAGYSRSADGSYNDHGLYHAPDDFYGLYLSGDSWWGRDVPGKPEEYAEHDSPVEKRVLDTVAWVIDKYTIDPDRVYLAGISMGGSGSLGIGMRHGEMFASTMVWVPAGTKHVARRMFFGKKMPAGLSIPDPPVVVDMSAQNDGWSAGQDVLIRSAAERKYPLIMGWAPFGHTGNTSVYTDNCGATMAFPWLEIRRNQAYPVFTAATSDQRPPWLNPDGDKQGQINAYFRWKNVEDTARAFSMHIWLAQPTIKTASPADTPKESVADITFRRLQKFRIAPGKNCSWELVRGGRIVASGILQLDAAGLLTVPKVMITADPAEIRLRVAGESR